MLRSLASSSVAVAAGLALMAMPAPAEAQYIPPGGSGIAIRTPNFSLGIGQFYRPAPVVVPAYPVPAYPAYPSFYGAYRPVYPVAPRWDDCNGPNRYYGGRYPGGPGGPGGRPGGPSRW